MELIEAVKNKIDKEIDCNPKLKILEDIDNDSCCCDLCNHTSNLVKTQEEVLCKNCYEAGLTMFLVDTWFEAFYDYAKSIVKNEIEISKDRGCESNSFYLTLQKETDIEELELKIRVSDHQPKYHCDYSFEPNNNGSHQPDEILEAIENFINQ